MLITDLKSRVISSTLGGFYIFFSFYTKFWNAVMVKIEILKYFNISVHFEYDLLSSTLISQCVP